MDAAIEVPDLTDGDLRLRPMEERDVPAVARICQDPEIQRWTRVPSPYDEDDAREFLRLTRRALAEALGAHLLAVGSEDEVVAAVGIDLDDHDRTGTVGYWVAPEARGRGVATRATRLLVGWAFDGLGVARCTLHAAVPNHASNAVARKVGFVHEGVLRGGTLVGRGDERTRVDANVWGLLRDDLHGGPAAPGRHRVRTGDLDLRGEWDAAAPDWIRWARAPGHDSYWRFHRTQFLGLLPAPGRRTLDLGCGEGRVSRDLRDLGHTVVGVDASPTMIAAARAAAPSIPSVVGDAAALPLASGSFDLVVAHLSLQDVDDVAGALREAGRVLEPGGRLCLAVVHPLNSAGSFADRDPASPFVIEGSYLAPDRYVDRLEREGLAMRFASAHHPIETYVEGLVAAGFHVEALREPGLPDDAVDTPRARRWQRVPLFLQLRAVRS